MKFEACITPKSFIGFNNFELPYFHKLSSSIDGKFIELKIYDKRHFSFNNGS